MKAIRIIWADSLKGWLILMVILGHSIQFVLKESCDTNHIWNMIHSFHVPAFMAVSGWFAYNNNRNGGIFYRRFRQLLLPCLIWSLIAFILRGPYTINNLLDIFLKPDIYFWFLWALFWINILFLTCQYVAKMMKIDETVLIALSCVILTSLIVGFGIKIFGLHFIAYYFLFYTFGYCLRRYPILIINNSLGLYILSTLWLFFAWYWKMHDLPTWLSDIRIIPSIILQYIYRAFTAAITILVLFGVAPRFLNSDTRFNHYIKQIGSFSLGLYVIHLVIIRYVIYCINIIMPELQMIYQVSASFLLTSLITIVIVLLLQKNKWTKKYLLGKI